MLLLDVLPMATEPLYGFDEDLVLYAAWSMADKFYEGSSQFRAF
jgi:hypothetical protein